MRARQADLRRAISNAYYALFHAILTEAADDFVGKTKRQSSRYSLVYRSVDRRSLRNLCDDIIKPNLQAKYIALAPQSGFGPDLIAMATAVIDLQEKRYSADYDPLFSVNMSDAVLAVATARTALARFGAANRNWRRAFISLVVFPPR